MTDQEIDYRVDKARKKIELRTEMTTMHYSGRLKWRCKDFIFWQDERHKLERAEIWLKYELKRMDMSG